MKQTLSCVRKCAVAVSEDETVAEEQIERPQPRHHSLNTGYGPEKALNWAGYVSVNGSTPELKRHLWYWFFESRNEPSTDPLVLWMTGGPGCSGLVALFKENGPYIIHDDLSLTLNPYSWNSKANVIWIDQPVGSGYSYADAGDSGPWSEAEIADNVFQFLQGFLSQYPKYSKQDFFVTGESYAGHYIPSVATRILAGNAAGSPQINLKALAIGNGLVDPAQQYAQYAPFVAATKALPQADIDSMEAGIPGCEAAIKSCSWSNSTGLEDCLIATEDCNLAEMIPFQLSGKNVYDIREACEVPPLCYNFTDVDLFLAQPAVAQALGVVGITWQSCNRAVDLALVFAGDWMRDLAPQVPKILGQGVRVVVYSGEYDFICNWYGGLAWTNNLVWAGQSKFVNAQNTTWTYENEEAGTSRTFGGFTFVRVKDAGHMVPLNQPARALDLLARVFSGAPFDNSQAEPKQVATPVTVAHKETHHASHTIALE